MENLSNVQLKWRVQVVNQEAFASDTMVRHWVSWGYTLFWTPSIRNIMQCSKNLWLRTGPLLLSHKLLGIITYFPMQTTLLLFFFNQRRRDRWSKTINHLEARWNQDDVLTFGWGGYAKKLWSESNMAWQDGGPVKIAAGVFPPPIPFFFIKKKNINHLFYFNKERMYK